MDKTNLKPAFLERYGYLINNYLEKSVKSYDDEISSHINFYFGWEDIKRNPLYINYQGKAFRPSLCLLVCESFEGNANNACPAAIAVELVHNFSLIHDDIEDNDKFRHHQLTLWAVLGIPRALVTGNAILALGNKELEKLLDYGISKEKLIISQTLLTKSYLNMMEGQFLDISFEKQRKTSKQNYLKMIGLKTGALIECSILLGAISSGKKFKNEDYLAISALGKNIGILYQIRDDILGIWGTDQTGKPVGSDISKKKKSLPLILTLASGNKSYKNDISRIMKKKIINQNDIQNFIEIMDSLDILKKCEKIAKQYYKKIQTNLKIIPMSSHFKLDFKELGEFLLKREN